MAEASTHMWDKSVAEVRQPLAFGDRILEVLCFLTCYNEILFSVTHVAMLITGGQNENNAIMHYNATYTANPLLHHGNVDIAGSLQVLFYVRGSQV
jgi:hypothetical protein